MKTVFYDLETSDFNPVGQILNFAFVEVDENWNMRSCLRDKIKISRLELPSPDAIAANKIDVIQHQAEATETEASAMNKIHTYLSGIIESDDTRLVGFNSSRFDLHYLRTSMIRNGLNPYFGGSVKYGDVFQVVKRLACDNQDFISKMSKHDSGMLNLSLEGVSRSLGLLKEGQIQDHESLSDVLLTIELAKVLAAEYSIDVRTYSSYEVPSGKKFDAIRTFHFSDESKTRYGDEYTTLALLSQNKTQSLWINLKMFEEGRGDKSVFGYNKSSAFLFVKELVVDDAVRELANRARQELSHIDFSNFYTEKSCDVEQFIYMLPMSEISGLFGAIWRRDLYLMKKTKDKFASQLYLRYLCKNAKLESVHRHVKEYALYRYGGKLKINKDNPDSVAVDGVYSPDFHVTYKELLGRLDSLSQKEELRSLMVSLRKFYEEGDMFKVAGEQLMNLPDRVKSE